MMFLANMLSKMKNTPLTAAAIAEVHNGSSLFTGDAGSGESNIRRWIIENDWLEAIVALPLNMFYNTGIATYIWVLSNRKPAHRQRIRAAHRRQPVVHTAPQEPRERRTASCRTKTSPGYATHSCAFEESEQSKIFPNKAFGYWKVTVDRPAETDWH